MIKLSDGSIIIETGLDSSGLEAGIGKMQSAISTGTKAAVAAITAVSTALVGIAGASIKVGSNFEEGMSKVSAISGATGSELQTLTDKAKEMGAKTKFSATESASAFEYMAMAGWKTEDMLGGIDGVMNLAAASGEDLASVSDIVTDAITAFGLSASDSTHFADVLAAASSNANTNVGMLGESFKYVAPIAGAMNYSVEDVSTALGLMANASVKGSMAGTSLKTALANMAAPTDNMAAVMEQYGISLENTDGSMKSLGEVITLLRDKMGGLSETEQTAAASTLFGKEAMAGMLAIINAAPGDYEKLTNAIYNADGSAQSMANTMQDNLKGSLTILGSALEGLGIEIYEGMEEPLRRAVDAAIEYVDQLTEAFNEGGLEGAVEEAGDIFAELAVKAAESAPAMIDAAVSVIEAFIGGLAKNKAGLGKAALDIAVTLANGLIKFLPKQMQKPAQDAVKAISTSLTSGGLKSAIDTACTTFGNLVKVVGNIAEVVLPPLTGAIDFLAGKIQYIIPVIAAAAAAFVALKIVTIITGGMQALSTALMAHTAIAKLATTAQLAFNMALTAGPIGILVAGLAAAVVGFGAYKLMTEDVISGEERLRESQEALAEAYSGIGKAASDFTAGIATAESHLSSFDSTLFASNEEQQQLSANMQEVQDGITTICRTASDERRDYTAEEIKQLDDYFTKLRELNDRQLAIKEQQAEAIRQQAITAAHDREADLGTYQQTAQEWINTAEQQADAQTEVIKSQTINEIALLNERRKNQKDMSAQEYQEAYDEIKAREELKISSVEREQARISKAYADGYAERITKDEEYNAIVQEANAQKEQEQERYNARIEELITEHKNRLNESQVDLYSENERFQEEKEKANSEHAANMGKIYASITDGMDSETKKQLGVWLSLLAQTTSNGKALDGATKETVTAMLNSWDELPEGSKDTIGQTIAPMLEGLSDSIPKLKDLSKENGQGIITALRDVLGIHSPSKETTEISQYAVQGLREPLEKGVPQMQVRSRALGSAIINTLQTMNLPSQARSLGIDFANGYMNGMSSKTSAVQIAAANLANAALAAVKKAQASASPSKKAAKLGKDFANGYTGGMKKQAKEAQKAAKDLTEKALKTLQKANGNYEEAGENAIDRFESGMESSIEKSEKKIEKLINKQVSAATKAYAKSIKDENGRLRATITDENKKTVEAKIKANEKNLETFKGNYKKMGEAALKAYSTALEKEAKSIKQKLSDTIDEITSEYQEKYDKVISLRDAMRGKLSGSSLFDRENGEIVLTDMNGEMRKIAKYEQNLTKLKNLVSADMMEEIADMAVEDALDYSDRLLQMSDAEIKQYSDMYDKKNAAAKDVSRKFYQNELNTIQTEFTGKINAAFAAARKEMESVGKNVAQGFIEGMKSQTKNLTSVVKKMSKEIIKQVKKDFGIKSPSKEFRGIAKNCTDGYELEYKSGMKGAEKTVSKSNLEVLAAARKSFDFTALAAQMRAGIAAENARMAQRVSSVVNYQVSGAVQVEEKAANRERAKLADEIVDAFGRSGISLKYNLREFGRLVKEVT